MATAQSTTLSRVCMTFECGHFGWTESWDMPYSGGGADPGLIPRNIATMRSLLLPPNAKITGVILRTRGANRHTLLAGEGESIGAATDANFTTVPQQADNDVGCALLFRVQGEDFMTASRFIRCVPDDQVLGDALVGPVPTTWQVAMRANGLPFDFSIKYTTWLQALQFYLSYIKLVCVISKKAIITQDNQAVNGFTYGPITNFAFRGVRSHKTGRPSNLSRGRAAIR